MAEQEASFVGKYVGGRYHVQAGVSLFESGIIAAHEEAHGILRRSSAYGAILTSAKRSIDASVRDRGAFALHSLASRSRTSEEVHATYQSYRSAASWPGRHDDVQENLRRFPSYSLYFDIGNELVGREPIAPLANAALDAIIRFCWSAEPLGEVELPVQSLTELRKIAPQSFPDERLQSLRRLWNENSLHELMDSVMGPSQPQIRELFGRSPEELYDPFTAALSLPPGTAFIHTPDFDVQMHNELTKHILSIAAVEENLVQKSYAYLAEKYAGTALAALSPDELNRYVMRIRKEDRTSAEVPEVTLLRSRPTTVQVLDEPQSPKGRRFVILRPRESFNTQFEVVGSNVPEENEPIVGYSVEAVYPEERPADQVLSIGLTGANPSGLTTAVRKLWERPTLVVIFASVVAQSPSEAWGQIEALGFLGHRVWFIGDIAPRECVRMVRSRMPEVRAFWHGPSHPNVGGLIVPRVGEGGPLQGVVYLGSRASLAGLLRGIMLDELGDDFRGFGSTIHLYEDSYRREKEGQFITHWLLATERRLG